MNLKNVKFWLKGRFGFLFTGGFMIFIGGAHFLSGKDSYFWGNPVKSESGLLISIIGIGIVLIGIFAKKHELQKSKDVYSFICVNCNSQFMEEGEKECKKCGGHLQNIHKYFEQNPNFYIQSGNNITEENSFKNILSVLINVVVILFVVCSLIMIFKESYF